MTQPQQPAADEPFFDPDLPEFARTLLGALTVVGILALVAPVTGFGLLILTATSGIGPDEDAMRRLLGWSVKALAALPVSMLLCGLIVTVCGLARRWSAKRNITTSLKVAFTIPVYGALFAWSMISA